MMDQMTDRQLSEWMAFEKFDGPISNKWRDEMAAQLHELIQLNNILTGAALTSKKRKKNPAGKFREVPRPWDLFTEEPEGEDEEEE